MTERRRGLGRGLGALIPTGPAESTRPSDVFFRERVDLVSRETRPGDVPGNEADGSADPAQAARERASSDGVGAVPAGTGAVGEARQAPDVSGGTAGDGTGSPQYSPRVGDAADGEGELRAIPGVAYGEIPLDLIRPNPRQPRTVFDPDELAELVASIREIGVLQPVVVRRIRTQEDDTASSAPAGGPSGAPGAAPADAHGDTGTGSPAGDTLAGADGTAPVTPLFELVMGERRWRASREAGLSAVPAIVKETADDALLRDALLENLHRSQLNPLEEAAAYQQLLDDFGCTHDELAARIGRSRPQISNTLRLLRLPPLVARRLAAGVLSAGHARALLGLDDAAAIERLAQRIVAEGLSVRSVEEIVALGGDPTPSPRRSRESGPRDGRLDDLAARLSDRFDTRVNVAMGRRKGRLTVEFASLEDLDRIVALLE